MSAVRLGPAHLAVALAVLCTAATSHAFCGFYVGKADAKLLNHASQVVLARDGDRTVTTMSNDYEGPLADFALVVPVPTLLHKEQIHVGERSLIEHLDAYSAPRLVEYFDPNPCEIPRRSFFGPLAGAVREDAAPPAAPSKERSRALGVKVEAEYAVGEYDIVILSAQESEGLSTWLTEAGYKIPPHAARALTPYIRQDMKFFVAKVNLGRQESTGTKFLRPIQIAYESKKFMLPIRLGMANAEGPQDLVIFTLTKNGRVESTNYRTVKMPTGMDVPLYVQNEFAGFYNATFAHSWNKEDRRALFTEYVWDTSGCDPCSATPPSTEELRQLGAYWLAPNAAGAGYYNGGTLLTRMHVRYDNEHFPTDLVFQETQDRESYQARYVLRHPAQGDLSCSAGQAYRKSLVERHQEEAKALADLTGWELATIRHKMGPDAPPLEHPWYERIWK